MSSEHQSTKSTKREPKPYNGTTSDFFIPCRATVSDGRIISLQPTVITSMARIYQDDQGHLIFVADPSKLDTDGNPR